MNRLLALALFVVNTASQALAGTASGNTFLFSRDERPVDGLLTEISLYETSDGVFTASLHRAWVDMITGKPGEETKVLGDNLACVIQASLVRCSKDDRPVDGKLIEITLTAGRQHLYTAVLRTADVDMTNGQPRAETSVVAEGLTRQLAF